MLKAILRSAPAVVALGLLLATTENLHAQGHCSRPIRPMCATNMPGVDVAAGRMKCRGDAERYVASLKEFRACLESGLAEATSRVEAAERFQACLEEEGSDCVLE